MRSVSREFLPQSRLSGIQRSSPGPIMPPGDGRRQARNEKTGGKNAAGRVSPCWTGVYKICNNVCFVYIFVGWNRLWMYPGFKIGRPTGRPGLRFFLDSRRPLAVQCFLSSVISFVISHWGFFGGLHDADVAESLGEATRKSPRGLCSGPNVVPQMAVDLTAHIPGGGWGWTSDNSGRRKKPWQKR